MDSALDFSNCDPVPMTWRQLSSYDGRIEYWDAGLMTAWVLRDGAGFVHETPRCVLVELMSRLSQERGSRVRCYGHAFLMVRDVRGRPSKVMCADQTIYLDPRPFRSTTDADAVVIGSDPLPDVVLEVDHTTDVRRTKLGIYEFWGFPEVWVETPDVSSRSRPKDVRRGLTIYLLEQGRYEVAATSRALPGWKASSIHRALNEEQMSPATLKDLARLGRVLGRCKGTGPDDDPQLGGHRRWAHQQGREAGLQEGRQKGLAEQRKLLAAMVERKFDVAIARHFARRLQEVDQPEKLAEAAGWIIECDDGADLLARLAAVS
ncbi:MAG: hypothetical protein OXU70_20580 [Gammaproteobacteria bacterium]|nr:hypothetical protein [Gammaproteobacteria bacterium]